MMTLGKLVGFKDATKRIERALQKRKPNFFKKNTSAGVMNRVAYKHEYLLGEKVAYRMKGYKP